MICSTCFGPVEWKGPFSNLTHTECLDCGRINNQIVDGVEEDAEQPQEEDAAKVSLNRDEIDLVRQWYNALCDTNKNYLKAADHALGKRITALATNFPTDDAMTPTKAREYIKNFKHILGREASYVRLSSGREIHFNSMTDDDAILVATGLQQMEKDAAGGSKGTQ